MAGCGLTGKAGPDSTGPHTPHPTWPLYRQSDQVIPAYPWLFCWSYKLRLSIRKHVAWHQTRRQRDFSVSGSPFMVLQLNYFITVVQDRLVTQSSIRVLWWISMVFTGKDHKVRRIGTRRTTTTLTIRLTLSLSRAVGVQSVVYMICFLFVNKKKGEKKMSWKPWC